MGVLNKGQLKEAIRDRKLIVTPLLEEGQIGSGSIDIRLGSSILIPRKTYIDSQDVTVAATIRETERRSYHKVRLQFHSKFVLHPNELILGVTFEYLVLPDTLSASIVSRSSWGRLGLIVATAAVVQPGYKGCLTLELVNLSESPIALYPGLPIGQLVFNEMNAAGEYAGYDGRYDCPTDPEPPRFFSSGKDSEYAFWGEREGSALLASPQRQDNDS